MSFGWYRAEVIGAMASVAMIWVITAILVWLAVERIINKNYEVDAVIMLITSGFAILVNLIMGCQLHGAGHGHSHSHDNHKSTKKSSHNIHSTNFNSTTTVDSILDDADDKKVATNNSSFQNHGNNSEGKLHYNQTIDAKEHNENKDSSSKRNTQISTVSSTDDNLQEKKDESFTIPISSGHDSQNEENMNVRAAFIHVVGDVLQSIGVFLAALLIYFKPEWAIADPICTFVFSIIVLCTTFKIMKDALLVLMEGTPSYLHYAEVMGIFQQIDGVERVHNLRIWALSVSKIALSVHLAIRPGANPKKILQEANTAVHLKYNFFETTIQIEDLTPDMDNCQQCTIPDS